MSDSHGDKYDDTANNMADDIYAVLEGLGITYVKHEHPPVFTVEKADEHRGKMTGGASKNLFLRNKKGNRHYLMRRKRFLPRMHLRSTNKRMIHERFAR